jgi:RNA-directed DNA polymerase
MKTYCKTVDITDRKLIQKAVYKCLKKKYKRRDSLTMFSEYTGLSTDAIKGMFNEFGLNGMKPMVETVVDGVREEINQGNIHFQPIWYKEKIDASSQKVRRIGIQNIKQQIYDYIAVEAMKDFLKRIGEYQCAALKGRGQSYGIKAIKRWMRNKNIRYAGQCDVSKCYPSIDRNKLMEFLRKYIKNEPLLELIEMLIMTFDTGLSIGSYLSQYLCNLFLSQIYHEIADVSQD